jgi:hypothetical protein
MVPSWSWSYDRLINNYLCIQCLSQIIFWVLLVKWWGHASVFHFSKMIHLTVYLLISLVGGPYLYGVRVSVRGMVCNATFNHIISISWLLLLLVGETWSWSYDRLINNYLCIQCLSQIIFWVRMPLRRGHDYSLSWIGQITSIEIDDVKLVLCSQTSRLSEMMGSCKCFPHAFSAYHK